MIVIKRLFGWLVLGPIALAVVALAVANRTPVLVHWNPFESRSAQIGLELPLFVVGFMAFAFGVLAGGLMVWLAQGRWRRAAKLHKVEVKQLSNEIAQMKPQTTALMSR